MPVVLVLLASVLFGTTGVTQRLGLPDADPLVTGALRVAVGGVLLGTIALLGRGRSRPQRSAVLPIALGAVGVVAYQPTFFAGVAADGVAVGTLVALGSAPVLTGLLGWAVLGRRPTRWWVGCTALALVGVALVSGLVGGGAAHASVGGILLSLAAAAAYAVYTLAVKRLLDLGWSTGGSVGAVFGVAGILSCAELPLLGAPHVHGPGWLAVAWLGVMTVTVAYLLFAGGLKRLTAATVSTITLAEPVVATTLGVVLLGETLTPVGVAGAVLLIAAIGLIGVPESVHARMARRVPAD